MPASAERIQNEVDDHLRETAQHKGLTLSIDVTAMDTGMYRVYNVPMAEHGPDFDPDAGVEQAIEHTGNLIRELYRRSAERRDRQ